MLSATNDSVKSFHESFYGKPTMEEPRRRRGKKRHPVAKEEPQNEVAVVGTHYRSFDDDTMATFVNSATALVPWNGDPKLLIDRYDVRHLLLDLTGIRRRRARPPSPDVTKEELDYERYRDVDGLENPLPPEDGQATDGNDAGGYQRVGFDYGIGSDLSTSKERVDEALFTPPFFVPEHLRASIPTSTKLHQIMAGTAKYVIEHGGQAEIVLRVKQANNTIFGFLMPDHPDHEYFRFLVAHPEYVGIAPDPQPVEVVPLKRVETSSEDTEGGLSLLGTAYGASDDDEGEDEGEGSPLDQTHDQQGVVTGVDDVVKVDGTTKGSDGQQDTGDLSDATTEAVTQSTGAEISQGEVSEAHDIEEPAPPGISEPVPGSDETIAPDAVIELPFKEPPVQLGRIIDKMVEFISRNGKEFEAIVRERDKANHRFPFFLPWNEYHPYYSQKLKAAREALTAGGEGAVSDASLVGDSPGVKEHQVRSEIYDDSFLTGVPFWDESFAVEADDGVHTAAIDSSGNSDLQPDEADQSHNEDGGMGFDAVLAAVRAATRGRPRGGESAEGTDLSKASELVERPEIGSDEAVLAAIRTATGQTKPDSSVSVGKEQTKPDSLVSAGKEEDTHGEPSNVLPESALGESTMVSTSHGAASVDVPDTLVGHSQVDNIEGEQASPTTGGSEGLPDVELAPAAKRKAERLKKAKLFAAMIKDRNSSVASPAQPSVPLEILEPSNERLSLTVMASDTNNNANSADKILAVSIEVEAQKRDLDGIGQPVDVQMQIVSEADEGSLGIEGKKGRKEKFDKEEEEKHLKRLQRLKDRERRNNREYSSEREEKRNNDHYQDTRKKDRKQGRHQNEAHEQGVEKVRNDREKEKRKEKEKAGSIEAEDGEFYEEDRNHRDREHKRKRKDSKHRHGDKKSSRRHGHESSKSGRERKHAEDLEKVRKESRHARDSREDERKDGRYGQLYSQDVDTERREGRHRHAETQIIRDETRRRHDSEERDRERYEEDDREDRGESRKERSRRHAKRRKHMEDSSEDSDEKYSRRHERRSKKSRRRNDDPDERSSSHFPEVREDTILGHLLERSESAGGNHEEKPPAPEKSTLSSADIPDDIRAKVRAMLAMS